jgi:hypothetical protein
MYHYSSAILNVHKGFRASQNVDTTTTKFILVPKLLFFHFQMSLRPRIKPW